MKPITFPLSTLILLATSLLTTLGTEQVCSSYDYEEKLLAKTIRLENTIEDLMNKTTEMETSFTMELETLETEIEKLNTRLNGMEYDTKTCPSNYMYSEALKLCWRLESTKVHWFDAVKLCSDEGARLIIFNSTDQASLVKEYIRAENSQPAWIGASDIIKEGVFMWINGELVQDMTSSTSTSSNCLAMSRYGIDDENCGIEYQLICQITVS